MFQDPSSELNFKCLLWILEKADLGWDSESIWLLQFSFTKCCQFLRRINILHKSCIFSASLFRIDFPLKTSEDIFSRSDQCIVASRLTGSTTFDPFEFDLDECHFEGFLCDRNRSDVRRKIFFLWHIIQKTSLRWMMQKSKQRLHIYFRDILEPFTLCEMELTNIYTSFFTSSAFMGVSSKLTSLCTFFFSSQIKTLLLSKK